MPYLFSQLVLGSALEATFQSTQPLPWKQHHRANATFCLCCPSSNQSAWLSAQFWLTVLSPTGPAARTSQKAIEHYLHAARWPKETHVAQERTTWDGGTYFSLWVESLS